MELISEIRIPGDDLPQLDSTDSSRADVGQFLYNELLVQHSVLPKITGQIADVAQRIGVPVEDVLVFIYASPFFQAECRRDGIGRCVLRLSSALVEALTPDELNFVVGHEIAHFKLGHLQPRERESTADSIEDLIVARRRELSADRVGYLACKSLSSALSAMMKSVSGLSERHLTIDVAAFISQIRSLSGAGGVSGAALDSHPAFVIRCRALLWFSMICSDSGDRLSVDIGGVQDTNARVLNDLTRYVEAPAQELIREAEAQAKFWVAAEAVAQRGAFTIADQQAFVENFGSELTAKLRVMLSGLSQGEALRECSSRRSSTIAHLCKIAPRVGQRFVSNEQ